MKKSIFYFIFQNSYIKVAHLIPVHSQKEDIQKRVSLYGSMRLVKKQNMPV